ncbi:MAG: DUF6295 family protein [Dehalococcoidia bacterium]|nr:DUF6295 family protein [Dehalococcoidia bacterium]
MCTMICERAAMEGSGKGREGWFPLKTVNVSYDHPFNAPWEYAVNIDFVNEDKGVGARVAVELSPESAKLLAETIFAALQRGEADPQIQVSVL